MSKILSFNGRDVILASNPETKSLTIEAANYGLLSSDIIKALRNDKAEGSRLKIYRFGSMCFSFNFSKKE